MDQSGKVPKLSVQPQHDLIMLFLNEIRNLHAQGYVFANLNIQSVVQNRTNQWQLWDLDFATPIGQPVKGASPINSVDPRLLAEQSEGGVPADEAMDLFSLGVIIYNIIQQNRPPFAGSTRKEVLENIQKGEIKFEGEVFSYLAFVAHGLMHSDPMKRMTFEEATKLLRLAVDDPSPKLLQTPLTVNINEEFEATERTRIMAHFNDVFQNDADDSQTQTPVEPEKDLETWIVEKTGHEPWVIISAICGGLILVFLVVALLCRRKEEPAPEPEAPKQEGADRNTQLVA